MDSPVPALIDTEYSRGQPRARDAGANLRECREPGPRTVIAGLIRDGGELVLPTVEIRGVFGGH